MGTAKLQIRFTIINKKLPARTHRSGSTNFQISGTIRGIVDVGRDEVSCFFVTVQAWGGVGLTGFTVLPRLEEPSEEAIDSCLRPKTGERWDFGFLFERPEL
jgi:hypothetical protein